MKFGKTVAMGWLALACTAGAHAQLSLASAVNLAWREAPTVKMAQADVDKAQAALAEAHDAYIPKVGANAGVGRSAGVPLDVPVIFGISGNSLLFNFSQRDYIRSARSGLRSATLAYQEAREVVAEDVVLTYVRLDSARKRKDATAEEYSSAQRLVTIVQERLEGGRDTSMDLLKARRTAAQIHLAELQTEDDVATLTDHLGRLVGLAGTPIQTEPDSIPAMLPPAPAEPLLEPDSFGVQSAFVNAASRQQQAFGDARWRLRPQIGFIFNYSRISTAFTNYDLYYPGFNNGKSENSLGIGIQISLPILDKEREAHSRASTDDARHALFDAENHRNQFLEGRFKLQHSTEELTAQADLAAIDRDIAADELKTVQLQLASTSASADGKELNPQDEQNARIQVDAKTVDLLNDQLALTEARINVMRQTGTLDSWIQVAGSASTGADKLPAKP